ncbi:hypothetical protein POJ06DRAFT_125886 [Lipomyces tetrasporus]|uniref:Uncharacterized protein n=1 Tax=Lipomyces tetrasporus TaxID=54092 RepID=A0AAD7QPC8_9ASCO|nr:uncharacterized protein POJ06DRAFT_125886 [Lipomyces tetrasporus]KAJ8098990.1 hypothetical protein POJ06DRAFT_125886 [Lipomyces tetrasporus]
MIEQVQENMKEVNRLSSDALSAQSADLLRQLPYRKKSHLVWICAVALAGICVPTHTKLASWGAALVERVTKHSKWECPHSQICFAGASSPVSSHIILLKFGIDTR